MKHVMNGPEPVRPRRFRLHTRLLHWIYDTLLTISWPVLFLYFRLRIAVDGKYSENHRQRLGMDMPCFGKSPGRIWFHALSVGEVLSVVPLVKAVKEMDPAREIAFSTATESGQMVARGRLSQWVSHFFHMPLDFPWAVRRLASRLKPGLTVITETDLWPNLLCVLRDNGVPCFLVNGRISPRSFGRLMRFRSFVAPVFAGLDTVFAQSAEDGRRFERLGVPGHRVHEVGNLKVDSLPAPLTEAEALALRKSLGLAPDRPVWIAGSTHEGEEEVLLRMHGTLRKGIPDLLLIIAPRDVRRAGALASPCARSGFPAARRSMTTGVGSTPVVILDTLGELGRFYALGRVAFIGGSLVPFGGHNPLEATAQGKFAVWGPHLFNFRQVEAALIGAGCGTRVSSAEELGEVVGRFLSDPSVGKSARERAMKFIAAQEGPARRIARLVLERVMQVVE